MSEPKTFVRSVRMSNELDAAARDVAHIDGISVNTLITEALEAKIAERRADPEFGVKLRARIAADQKILDRLDNPT